MTSNLGIGKQSGHTLPMISDPRSIGQAAFDRLDANRVPVPRPRWEAQYAGAVVAVDLVAVASVVVLGHVLGLGDWSPRFGGEISPQLGIVVALLTALSLFLNRAWDQRALGQGSEEFSRLIRAFVTSAVVLGLAGLALELPAVRPWVFGLLPLAGLGSLLGRFFLRKWLHRQRINGRFVHPMLAIGTAESVADLIRRARRDPYNGWSVAGVCTPTGAGIDGGFEILGVPVLGDLDSVTDVVRRGEHRVVSVGNTPGWSPRRLHQLAWDLEGSGTDLVVDPGLMEMAGPRLHVAPVDGFPMLRLTEPAFDGVSRVVKNGIDWLGAALLLIVIAPLMLGLAIAVKADGGPAFFRQERVGRHGRIFKMIKFRSMVVDAEARKAALVAANEGAGPLFKMRADPRITRVGATLRKYSLDELPQLFNVLVGSMSLVGPRPPLPEEVVTYSRDAERRLLVKPGLTGLWQVSGRSDLSWEESVRLDLRYVENWTLAMDALILWKTIGTLSGGRGAY
jgi:exopolysaccharide biosynthesis polyprenyl glycosylphosphotransferase